MRTSRTIAIATLTLIFAVGCGTEGTPNVDPTNDPTAAASDPSETTGSDGPDVPADWQVASIDVAQVQAPPDWSLRSTRDLSQTLRAPKDEIGISPGAGGIQADVYSSDGSKKDFEELAKLHVKDLSEDYPNFKRLPNETINGSLFFHFQTDDDQTWQDRYGTLDSDGENQVTITWKFNKSDIDRKGAEALIAQIMPTYQDL